MTLKPGLELPKWRTGMTEDGFQYVGPPHDRLYKQGKCRVCEIALFGKEPVERDVCGNSHCQVEAKRKRPCKFKRLRNVTL